MDSVTSCELDDSGSRNIATLHAHQGNKDKVLELVHLFAASRMYTSASVLAESGQQTCRTVILAGTDNAQTSSSLSNDIVLI